MEIFSSINNMQKTQNYPNVKFSFDKLKNAKKDENVIQITNDKEKLKKELKKVVEELNKSLNPLNTSLKFSFNDKVDILTVKVIDSLTNETIREFPPKEALKLMEKMKEFVGMLFDRKG